MTISSASTDARPLTERLKENHADLHERAEHGAVPQAMATGEISREAYASMLGQLWVMGRALDEALVAAGESTPAIRDLVKEHQLQEPKLRADLAHFGIDPATIEAGEAAGAFVRDVERLRESEPLRLLGLHYVREGATNGNRFVAMKIRKAWGVEGSEGFRHLDPYGDQQRSMWDAWKTELAGYEFSEQEKQTILAGARTMFEHVMAVHESVDLA